MPGGILDAAYEALGSGDSGPLLGLVDADFEWVEPELPGYPLAGVHRGPGGARAVLTRLATLLDGLAVEVDEVIEAGGRAIVTGVMRGRPAGAEEDWNLPFAHVWELDADGRPTGMRAFFDRSRLTLAAARRDLAGVADDLLEQAAEIRRQWARLGDALRAAGMSATDVPDPAAGEDLEPEIAPSGSASARLAAVDMAEEGATREEVEAYLRDELAVDDPAAILDEVFGAPVADEAPDAIAGHHAAALEASRLSRLFARNRG